jgi:hypothetical protein
VPDLTTEAVLAKRWVAEDPSPLKTAGADILVLECLLIAGAAPRAVREVAVDLARLSAADAFGRSKVTDTRRGSSRLVQLA